MRARGRQRTDSTHVLAAIRALNRIEVVAETMRHALDSLAVAAPEWLAAVAAPEWVERYARRAEDDRLPDGKEAREALARLIGADGHALLAGHCGEGIACEGGSSASRRGVPARLRAPRGFHGRSRAWALSRPCVTGR